MKGTIVVAGSLAQRPYAGGHAWQFLQYLLGFRRIGWDVLFLDRLEPEMCRDEAGHPCSVEDSANLAYFTRVLEGFGLGEHYSLGFDRGRQTFGLSRARVIERIKSSALLLNIMGFLDDDELLAAAPRRAFLDTDPGFGQMWQDLGLATLFHGHDDYITIAENVGKPDCAIPTLGLRWITTCQPVLLDEWRREGDTAAGHWITGIGAWRGAYDPVEHNGTRYGLRVHEFRKFVTLPQRTQQPFQLALEIDDADGSDRALLESGGWCRIDPRIVTRDPWRYRRYLHESRAEIMIAKEMYVLTRSGWFSERSMCYLAASRPVLAQDTGITGLYPTGAGLVTFSTLDQAIEAVHSVAADYDRHTRAAREIAEEYFDSNRVLPRLLGKLALA
jgi:hypothetical protein